MAETSELAQAAEIREWVHARLPYSTFDVGDVPGSRTSVRSVLSRLAKDDDSPVRRLCRGRYFLRGVDPESGKPIGVPTEEWIASQHLGRGSGLGSFSALCGLGWTWQPPLGLWVAGVIRNGNLPKPPVPQLKYFGRTNQRRLDLTWNEVSLLEALRGWLWVESDYHQFAVDSYVEPGLHWEDKASVMRPDAVAWAIEREPAKLREQMTEVLGRLCVAIDRKLAMDAAGVEWYPVSHELAGWEPAFDVEMGVQVGEPTVGPGWECWDD